MIAWVDDHGVTSSFNQRYTFMEIRADLRRRLHSLASRPAFFKNMVIFRAASLKAYIIHTQEDQQARYVDML
jgi:hypothetical protein